MKMIKEGKTLGAVAGSECHSVPALPPVSVLSAAKQDLHPEEGGATKENAECGSF